MLVRTNRRATALYQTGAWPQASYGIEGTVVSQTQIQHLRAQASEAVGSGSKGACPITTIAIVVGLKHDPGAQIVMSSMREHLTNLDENHLKHHDPSKGRHCKCISCILSTTWPLIREELRQATLPWAKVKGPIGNLIMFLANWGINMQYAYTLSIPNHGGRQPSGNRMAVHTRPQQ